MSGWQRAHDSLVMKNVAGMTWPVVVLAEDGKNGLRGPSPSPSIEAGGRGGLTMRPARAASRRSWAANPTATGIESSAATAPVRSWLRAGESGSGTAARATRQATASVARTASATCA